MRRCGATLFCIPFVYSARDTISLHYNARLWKKSHISSCTPLEHSIEDTLYLIPFLFVTYLAMEWLEHKTGGRTQEAVQRAGAAGPVLGSLLGVIPQCGFSAAAGYPVRGACHHAWHGVRRVLVHV